MKDCEKCSGTGTVDRQYPDGEVTTLDCIHCGGRGLIQDDGPEFVIRCWCCRKQLTKKEVSVNVGYCPYCAVEIDLEDY